MKLQRLLIQQTWLWALGLTLTCAFAQAQSHFPNRPIKVINPLPPGGALDAMLRRIGQAYNDSTGQPMVIESKPGANSIIAAEACAAANPDGYTILFGFSGPLAVNPHVFREVGYDVDRDFAALTRYTQQPMVMTAHPAFAADVARMLEADFAQARQIGRDDFLDSPALLRVAMHVAKLFAPIL